MASLGAVPMPSLSALVAVVNDVTYEGTLNDIVLDATSSFDLDATLTTPMQYQVT